MCYRAQSFSAAVLVTGTLFFACIAVRSVAAEPSTGGSSYRPGATSATRGLVEVDGRWLTIDEACRLYREKESVGEYGRLRDAARWTVEDQIRMARWCLSHDLKDSADFHYKIVLQLDARNKEARNALDVKNFHGLLLTDEEIAEVRAEAAQRKEAIDAWKPKLRELRRKFQHRNAEQRAKAAQDLIAIDEPSVLPGVEASLANLNKEAAVAMIQLAAKFQQQEATDLLVRQGMVSPFAEAREEVARALGARSYFAWVPQLLGLMESPVEVHVRTTNNVAPSFALTLFRRGPFADELVGFNDQTVISNVQTVIEEHRIVVRDRAEMWDGPRKLGETGYQVPNDPQRHAARMQIAANTIAEAEQHNERVGVINQRVAYIMSQVTDLPADTDLATWYRWWYEYNEYPIPDETPLYSNVVNYSQGVTATNTVSMGSTTFVPPASSCFLAGTPVTTKSGIQPIETVKIGDFVLAQDVDTGELKFKPVTATTFGPVTMMYKLQAEGTTVYPTAGHPFWVIDEGWKMAKDIKPGDRLFTLSGPIVVNAVAEWGQSTTHNLVVADFNNYFVSDRRVLVHDITIRRPTTHSEPGVPAAVVAQAR